jgi:putative NADPH-quinone reductase
LICLKPLAIHGFENARMTKRVLIIQGHPDSSAPHLLHALAIAYSEAARNAGHEVRTVTIAELEFPLLRSQHEWEHGAVPASLVPAQQDIAWAEHVALFFPLWLGDMPALVKGFLEQVARPGFAFKAKEGDSPFNAKGLTGRSARIVVSMGMPALLYSWFFRAHSVKSLERNILSFVGFAPVRHTLIGMTSSVKPQRFVRWTRALAKLGERAE